MATLQRFPYVVPPPLQKVLGCFIGLTCCFGAGGTPTGGQKALWPRGPVTHSRPAFPSPALPPPRLWPPTFWPTPPLRAWALAFLPRVQTQLLVPGQAPLDGEPAPARDPVWWPGAFLGLEGFWGAGPLVCEGQTLSEP